MTILVFGKTGQVATELGRMGGVALLDRSEADLSRPDNCAEVIRDHQPNAVINAAAYTDVDGAEAEPDLARRINADAPAAMARVCKSMNIPLVHISTDYVFDGTGTAAWKPDDDIAPLGVYGATKAAGEEGIRAAKGRHVILRTSWVFSAHGSNFVKSMLKLGRDRDELRIVADQIGGPTPARDLAAACHVIAQALVARQGAPGTYHLSGAPDISWADFARTIFDMAGMPVTVQDITTAEYPTPARRPANSRLDCTTLDTVFGLPRPDWRDGLRDVLDELDQLTAKEAPQ